MQTIYLAGGCFWGVEAYFQAVEGVVDTTVGYAQGSVENPNYEAVCTGKTGHTETVEIVYDETKVSLTVLLTHLFRIINPTSLNRQGEDKGTQYRTGIYSQNEHDLDLAKSYIALRQAEYSEPIVVEVESFKVFFRAEEYHQDYLQKNSGGYCHVDLSYIPKIEE